MTSIKRPAAALAAAALAFTLTACGGGSSDAPDNASVDEFCEAMNDTSVIDEVDEEDHEAQADAAHEQADKLREVGTPEDMPEDAREGWEAFIDWMGEVDADDVEAASNAEDPNKFMEEEFETDKENIEALFTYMGENCSGTTGE